MSPYADVVFEDLEPFDARVTTTRSLILEDIQKHHNQSLLESWFAEDKWRKNQFTYCTIATTESGRLIGMSSCRVLDDKSLKVLCHYYLIKNMRGRYRSISQTDFVPRYVEYARKNGILKIWMSVHEFDRRHARLAQSITRPLNREGNNRIPRHQQPYVDCFRYIGEVVYNSTLQKKYELDLTKIEPLV